METETYIIEVGDECCCKDISDECDTIYYDVKISVDFYRVNSKSGNYIVYTAVGYCYDRGVKVGDYVNLKGSIPDVDISYNYIVVGEVIGKKCYSDSTDQYNFRSTLDYWFT